MRPLLRAAALVVGVLGMSAVCAQSPAVNPTEATAAEQQQQRQLVQPYNNAPVWREARSGQPLYTSIPGRETNVLIQSGGQTWRAARVPVSMAGGFVFALALLSILGYFMWRGPIGTEGQPTGHLVRRYTAVERTVHWANAIAFVTLGLTGLVITFGKFLLLPLIGYTLFSWLAVLAKNVHNFTGPVFVALVPIMIVVFARESLPRAYDWQWIKKFGGMLDRVNHAEIPSGKANAGQKAIFWLLVFFLSTILAVTGLILDFPNFNQTRQTMQIANVVHMIAGLAGVSVAAFHIYLGTIGMAGAYQAMRTGYVDETWARSHHAIWYDEVMTEKRELGIDSPPPELGRGHA